jgi:hypothetical protein
MSSWSAKMHHVKNASISAARCRVRVALELPGSHAPQLIDSEAFIQIILGPWRLSRPFQKWRLPWRVGRTRCTAWFRPAAPAGCTAAWLW